MSERRISTTLAWAVLVICVMPFLLNLSVLVSISPAASFGKPKRIGVIQTTRPSSASVILDALVQRMRASGYLKGWDYELIVRAVPHDIERAQKAAKELESEGIDLLVTIGTPLAVTDKRHE